MAYRLLVVDTIHQQNFLHCVVHNSTDAASTWRRNEDEDAPDVREATRLTIVGTRGRWCAVPVLPSAHVIQVRLVDMVTSACNKQFQSVNHGRPKQQDASLTSSLGMRRIQCETGVTTTRNTTQISLLPPETAKSGRNTCNWCKSGPQFINSS